MYLVYLILLMLSFQFLKYKVLKKDEKIIIFIISILILYIGTFAYYTDDYVSYEEIVQDVNRNHFLSTHLEEIWLPYIKMFQGDVSLFRFCSIFVLLSFVFVIAKCANVDKVSFILFYIVLCLSTHFCWIRQPISMCAFLLSILLLNNKKILLSICLIIVSLLLHKSSVLLIVLLPFCLIPLGKKTLVYSILLFPLMFKIFDLFLSVEIIPGLNIQYYLELESEYRNRNFLFKLFSLFATFSQFGLIILTLIKCYKITDFRFELLFRVLYGVCILSFFLFIYPIDNNVLYKRLLAFGMFAIIPLWCEIIKKDLFKKKYKLLYRMLWLMIIIRELTVAGKHINDLELLLKL